MGIPILVRQHLYIETAPGSNVRYLIFKNNLEVDISSIAGEIVLRWMSNDFTAWRYNISLVNGIRPEEILTKFYDAMWQH